MQKMKLLFSLFMIVLLAIISMPLQAQTPGQKEADSLIKAARRLYRQHQYNAAARLYQKAKQVWPNCKDCAHGFELCMDAAKKEAEVIHMKNEQEKISRSLRQVTTENEQLDFRQRNQGMEIDSLGMVIRNMKKEVSEKEALISQAQDSLDGMKEDRNVTQKEKRDLKAYTESLSRDAHNKDRTITELEA